MAAAGVDEDDWILVHDAARPGLTVEAARRLIDAVIDHGFVAGGKAQSAGYVTFKLRHSP